jgi:hypothetical protein
MVVRFAAPLLRGALFLAAFCAQAAFPALAAEPNEGDLDRWERYLHGGTIGIAIGAGVINVTEPAVAPSVSVGLTNRFELHASMLAATFLPDPLVASDGTVIKEFGFAEDGFIGGSLCARLYFREEFALKPFVEIGAGALYWRETRANSRSGAPGNIEVVVDGRPSHMVYGGFGLMYDLGTRDGLFILVQVGNTKNQIYLPVLAGYQFRMRLW